MSGLDFLVFFLNKSVDQLSSFYFFFFREKSTKTTFFLTTTCGGRQEDGRTHDQGASDHQMQHQARRRTGREDRDRGVASKNKSSRSYQHLPRWTFVHAKGLEVPEYCKHVRRARKTVATPPRTSRGRLGSIPNQLLQAKTSIMLSRSKQHTTHEDQRGQSCSFSGLGVCLQCFWMDSMWIWTPLQAWLPTHWQLQDSGAARGQWSGQSREEGQGCAEVSVGSSWS